MRISCTDSDIKIVIKKIKAGEIIVFPTDTVYGIGCDPYNKNAILRLYEIKKRDKTKPFPILGLSKLELEKIAVFNTLEGKIAEKFWPGQVTLVLEVKDEKLRQSLCLDKKIAVRVPDNQCILSLLKECKFLVGTSANISGTAPFTNPNDCSKNIIGYDLLIDGGIISSQSESTIVEIVEGSIKILREGNISEKEIRELN